jgi:hypothetical protein
MESERARERRLQSLFRRRCVAFPPVFDQWIDHSRRARSNVPAILVSRRLVMRGESTTRAARGRMCRNSGLAHNDDFDCSTIGAA